MAGLEMRKVIFKRLEARRIKRRFGSFISNSDIEEIVGSISEWQAFKALLPAVLKPKVMTEQQAYKKLTDAIEQALGSRAQKAP